MVDLDLDRIRADAEDAADRRMVADGILPTLTRLVVEDVPAMADEIVILSAELNSAWTEATELRRHRDRVLAHNKSIIASWHDTENQLNEARDEVAQWRANFGESALRDFLARQRKEAA